MAQIIHDKAHAHHSEVAHANLNKEKGMDIEVADHNLDLLVIVPYVKPNSHPVELPVPHVEKLFFYQVITAKATRWILSYFCYCRCYFHDFNINLFTLQMYIC